jgi:hypothetical protein
MMPRGRSDDPAKPVKIRLRESVLQRVEAAAARRGVSFNQEIVERLANSFEVVSPSLASDDPTTNAIVELLTGVIHAAGRVDAFTFENPIRWYDSAFAFNQVCKAVNEALQAIKPPGTIELKDIAARLPAAMAGKFNDNFLKDFGMMSAWSVLHELKMIEDPECKILNPEVAERARRLKTALGHIADRISENASLKET